MYFSLLQEPRQPTTSNSVANEGPDGKLLIDRATDLVLSMLRVNPVHLHNYAAKGIMLTVVP